MNSKGDVGELNTKSASRSTIIVLTGTMLGMLIVPYITIHTFTIQPSSSSSSATF
ncbi:hypothetical protein AZE42_08063 [Rhizopogon vesiculosus]|uniref:Uncharacterized protein n=1 Tax=Rhizopogon vesiculosus TaxID=180088 RepID=A0A1J8Q6N2_9AGAM|nr:hypothetical protein AZE42_08063 [Rhizopogon vesiculosus]